MTTTSPPDWRTEPEPDMEGTSEVILRNAGRVPSAPVLLVNAPRDGLSTALRRYPGELRHSTQDFGDYRWLQAGGLTTRFETTPALSGDEGLVILHLPREKERLAMLLHGLVTQMDTTTRLWLVGENRAGIKSATRYLERRFERIISLDQARHCGLFEAESPRRCEPFFLDSYLREWSVRYAGAEVRLASLPGVFAHGRLDAGTALLLKALAPLQPRGRVLDFACGSGIVGVALGLASTDTEPTLLDSSALAIESSRRALQANGIAGRLLPSDGLSELHGRFDWIVSNPPFHRGVRNDLDVASEFFRQAGGFLTPNGIMVIVFNRHLPYLPWLKQTFGTVERHAGNREFLVILAAHPEA